LTGILWVHLYDCETRKLLGWFEVEEVNQPRVYLAGERARYRVITKDGKCVEIRLESLRGSAAG